MSMETTTLLAQIWGPVVLAIGIGMFVSRSSYVQIYRDLEKNTLTLLIFGMSAMGAGIAQVLFHNSWETLPEIFISLLGWGMLLKGAAFVVLPQFINKTGNWWVKRNLLWLTGMLMLLLGTYLTWFGYSL